MKKLAVLIAMLLVLIVPLTVNAAPLLHPAPNSMGEPSVERPFGFFFDEVRGDYRQSLGQPQESIIQTRDAYLTYFENRVKGARTGSTHTSSFVIQPIDKTDWNIIKNRTGQAMYYVGRHDKNAEVVQHLERAINNYAKFYNGNAQFIKDIILAEVTGKVDYYDFRDQPIYQYGSPSFSIQDMFMLTGDDLFFRIPYVSRLSGAGNPVLVESYLDDFDPFNPPEDPIAYFSKAGQVWEQTTTEWPTIKNVQVLENGDVEYTFTIHAVYDNKGYVDVIGNFEQKKALLPNSHQLGSLDLYWRKHAHEYFRNLVGNQEGANAFKNSVIELEIPFTPYETQTFTHIIPKADVERILNGDGNMITVYVTDNYGRYAYKEVPYGIDLGCSPILERPIGDSDTLIYFPPLPSGYSSIAIGGYAKWSLTYNANACRVIEGVNGHNDKTLGHEPSKKIYLKNLGLWEYRMTPTKDGVTIENISSSDELRPLNVQLKKGNTIVERFQLERNQKKTFKVTKDGQYSFYFPSLTEVEGFWDNVTDMNGSRKVTSEYPDLLRPHILDLVNTYSKK